MGSLKYAKGSIGTLIAENFYLEKEAKMIIISRLFTIIFVIQVLVGYFASSRAIADEIDTQGLYAKHCVLCHGEDGKGKTDIGEGLGTHDFTEKGFQDSISDEKIVKQITDGTKEKMFPFKDKLAPEEIKALVPIIRAFGKGN